MRRQRQDPLKEQRGKTMNEQRTAEDTWDAILHEVAMEDAEDGKEEESEREQQWMQSLVDSTHARLAELRHSLLLKPTAPKRPVAIRAELYSLDREPLLARLAQLLQHAGPSAQLAYRDRAHQSDDDLRLLVTILEEPSAVAN
jgi:hypothetical protein